MKNFHVAIIGGGVIGSAIAWELSKYKMDIVLFEKGSDVASGASKANSGVIHSGINSKPRSLKARFCVEGNKMFQNLSNELGFSVKWVGKYVIAKDENEISELENLKNVGLKNNVLNLDIVDLSDIKKKEPNVKCYKALQVPSAGIISPYEFTIALAENAVLNNVNFLLETKVKNLKLKNDYYYINTDKGDFKSEFVVNSAGLNCREIVSMLEEPGFNVYPCRGEYLVLDKNYCNMINSMIYPVPVEEFGVLGVHITPTIDGKILLGPSAEYIDNYDEKCTTKKMMDSLLSEAKEIIPNISDKDVINSYSGVRCKIASPKNNGWADYIIEESKITPGFIKLLGIESPGLTAAPAIAKEIVRIISTKFDLFKKSNFKKIKIFNKRFTEIPIEQQSNLIKKDKRNGRIICRCENVTEAEVIKALSNPLKARTLSSVKYRCRVGMGRCQGGFCTQHIVRIMRDDFNMDINEIKLKSDKSNLFFGKTRE